MTVTYIHVIQVTDTRELGENALDACSRLQDEVFLKLLDGVPLRRRGGEGGGVEREGGEGVMVRNMGLSSVGCDPCSWTKKRMTPNLHHPNR